MSEEQVKEEISVTSDAPSEPTKKVAPLSEDKLTRYPKDVDVPALAERRYLWVMRVFAVAFAISMALNLVLVYVVATIFPLKRVEPFLVTFRDRDQQLVNVTPMSRDMNGFQMLTESLIRQYVSLTEEIVPNKDLMNQHWGRGSYVEVFSSPDVYEKFTKRSMPALDEFLSRNWTRTIKITALEEVTPGFWNIEYETSVLDETGTPIQKDPERWLASMTVSFQPRAVTYEKSLLNPVGFTVTAFGVRPKQTN